MRKIVLILVAIMIATAGMAQKGNSSLTKGATQLNMGLGFNSDGLPLYVGIDYAVHQDVTLGPQLNVVFDDDASLAILARGDYHFNRLLEIPNEWDVYAGANAGINLGQGDALQLGIQIGGRWFWNDKWGLNLEFGGGNTYSTTLGVSMKF